MIYICRSFHNVGYFIGFLIIDCPELELESLKVGKAEKGGKKRKGGKRWKRRLWFCNQPFGKISVMIIISLHSFLTSKACQWQHVTDEMSFKKSSQLLNGESHIGQTHLKMTTRAVAIHLKHQLLYKRHLEHQPL